MPRKIISTFAKLQKSCFVSLFSVGQQQTRCSYISHTHQTDNRVVEKHKTVFYGLSTIWYNTYGCKYHCICATELYLLSALSQAFHTITVHGISASGHDREVVGGINAT